MELVYGLIVEAEIDVVKGLRTRLRELAEQRAKAEEVIYPHEIMTLLEDTDDSRH